MSTIPIDDGGPAFARPAGPVLDGDVYHPGTKGMTLLDWFAGQALKGYLSGRNGDARDTHPDTTAYHCYTFGKSMIGVRNELANKPDGRPADACPNLLTAVQRISRELQVWKEHGSKPEVLMSLVQAWPGYIADAKDEIEGGA